MPRDGSVGETEGLEDRDLFALQRDLSTHDGVGHERGDAQKNERKSE